VIGFRAATLALLVAGVGLGGCIDKEPGLAAELKRATVTVRGQDPDATVSVRMRVRVRVGKHALNGRDFTLSRAQVLAGDVLGAEVPLQRPAEFEGTLEPGESVTVDIQGEAPMGAFDSARGTLCGGESVQVRVQWEAELSTGDPSNPMTMEFGMFSGMADEVRCG
jgi:hypothetical protein